MLKRLNILFEKGWFPVSLKIITFFAFWFLIFIGLSARSDHPVLDSQLYRTNLTNVFVWDIWWPLILLSALVFGRMWCMVCPVEIVTSFFSKIGLRLKRPAWLTSGWVITLFYAVIVITGVTVLEIDFNPRYTAWYLLIIFIISVITGLIFEKNTFCRYVCPVGYLLGIFSRMAAWGWRVKDRSVCRTCSDKSCISDKYLYNISYKSCGVDLYPSDISDNNHCILCGGCMKVCKTYRKNPDRPAPNPSFTKIGLASDLLQIKPFKLAEWVFLYFLTAHLIDEITEFQLITTLRDLLFPERISALLNINDGTGKDLITTGFLFFLLPVFLWGLPYLVIRLLRNKMSFADYLKKFSLAFVPVIVCLFVGLIIWEISVRVPYYKYIITDPIGVRTIQGILTKQLLINRIPDWADWIFLFMLLSSLVAGIILSFRVIKNHTIKYMVNSTPALYLSVFVFIFIFFGTVLLYHSF